MARGSGMRWWSSVALTLVVVTAGGCGFVDNDSASPLSTLAPPTSAPPLTVNPPTTVDLPTPGSLPGGGTGAAASPSGGTSGSDPAVTVPGGAAAAGTTPGTIPGGSGSPAGGPGPGSSAFPALPGSAARPLPAEDLVALDRCRRIGEFKTSGLAVARTLASDTSQLGARLGGFVASLEALRPALPRGSATLDQLIAALGPLASRATSDTPGVLARLQDDLGRLAGLTTTLQRELQPACPTALPDSVVSFPDTYRFGAPVPS